MRYYYLGTSERSTSRGYRGYSGGYGGGPWKAIWVLLGYTFTLDVIVQPCCNVMCISLIAKSKLKYLEVNAQTDRTG